MKQNKQLLEELLKDADDYAAYQQVNCPAVYLLGGSGCILGDYIDRATLDIDFLDLQFDASTGKIFRLFGRFDMRDIYTTTIAEDYASRATKLTGYRQIDYYVLSREDIIVSKLARYSTTDREDIAKLIQDSDRQLISRLIDQVMARNNLAKKVRQAFVKNSKLFKEQYNV